MSSVACLVSPFSFVHVISQIPDADTVALPSCALLSCVATRASAFDDEGVSASVIADGARLACAAIVAMPLNKSGITHNNFILFLQFPIIQSEDAIRGASVLEPTSPAGVWEFAAFWPKVPIGVRTQ